MPLKLPRQNLWSPLLFLATVVLLGNLVAQASALKCYHCLCRSDCESNPELDRECPSEMDACLTQEGPGDQVLKTCGKQSDGETGANGQKNKYCTKDLCNDLKVTKPAAASSAILVGSRFLATILAIGSHGLTLIMRIQ